MYETKAKYFIKSLNNFFNIARVKILKFVTIEEDKEFLFSKIKFSSPSCMLKVNKKLKEIKKSEYFI